MHLEENGGPVEAFPKSQISRTLLCKSFMIHLVGLSALHTRLSKVRWLKSSNTVEYGVERIDSAVHSYSCEDFTWDRTFKEKIAEKPSS